MSETLRTERLTLVPLDNTFAGVHDAAECSAAERHWREHGFGNWAVLDETGTFVGAAEVHFAYPGVTGIAVGEVEVGWTIGEVVRNRGLATEAMRAAIADAWTRTGADHLVAYISPGNAPSHRVAQKLGFTVRAQGRTRAGDPMTVYELHAP
ncbi:MAG TPA: GNAT family N-acetyltransferase [Gaiellaceae bacterium]|nr:GNAT family N-acetyltransferase [Gaiellaceae bacterium]